MPTTFRPYHPNQPMMMPPDLRDWLPSGHLAFQISDLVDSLDLAAFYTPYEGDGRRNRPYEPAMMVKVLLYGYSVGVFSSRKIAQRLREDVAFRFLAASDRLPAHRTICEFRRRHLKDFGDLFVQVVKIAAEMGLTKLGTLAVDASKVRACASKRKAMTYERMQAEELRLRGEINQLLERAERADAAEDERYGEDSDGDDTPDELKRRRSRLQKIEQAKARLEQQAMAFDNDRGRKPGQRRNPRGGSPYKRAYGEPDPKAQHNFTDPESSIMKTSTEGFQQTYNAQAAVDSESRLIVAAEVSARSADAGQLLPMIEKAERNVGRRPDIVLADAGYASEDDFKALEGMAIDAYVSLGREGRKPPEQLAPARRRMAQKLGTPEGRRTYANRKHIAEPPFGWIKQVLGFRRFSFRGLEKVRGEWDLVCLALNARRIGASRA